jgi:diguanylate cyclase (GGDEF)-like protein/PAS domain S-box-containing protein
VASSTLAALPPVALEALSRSRTDAVVTIDEKGIVSWASPSARPMLGWDPEALIGRRALDLLHPDELPRAAAVMEASLRGYAPRSTARYRVCTPDGGYDECDMSIERLDTHGGIALWIRLATDQLVLERVIRGLLRGEPTTDVVAEAQGLVFRRNDVTRCAITLRDAEGQVICAESSLPSSLAGLDLGEDSPWTHAQQAGRELLFEDLDRLPAETAKAARKEGLGAGWIVPVVSADGEWLASITLWTLCDGPSPRLNAYPVQLMSQLVEVVVRWGTQRAALERAATRDPLTGLFNRRALSERIGDDAGSRRGILYLDLDHFKPINDTHGHGVGDRVLAAVAKRIMGAVRPDDGVGRFGGDEFVVLCQDVDRPTLEEIAERIRQRVSQMLVVDGHELRVSVSVGLALGGATDTRLLEEADRALYRAKSSGRNRICWAGD